MTPNNPENPPAFPTHDTEKEPGQAAMQVSHGGMTLRDYFAAKAINLFSMNDAEVERLRNGDWPVHAVVARFCYDLADAMLAACQKGAQ